MLMDNIISESIDSSTFKKVPGTYMVYVSDLESITTDVDENGVFYQSGFSIGYVTSREGGGVIGDIRILTVVKVEEDRVILEGGMYLEYGDMVGVKFLTKREVSDVLKNRFGDVPDEK